MFVSLFAGLLALLSLVSASDPYANRREDHVLDTKLHGGPHGKAFSDLSFVDGKSGHRRISTVTIGPCDGSSRISYIKFEFTNWKNTALPVTVAEHGSLGKGQKVKSLVLKKGEHIRRVGVWTGKAHVGAKWKTRLSGIGFGTDKGQSISCGIQGNKEDALWELDSGRAFLYFSGAAGDAIDNFMGHSIPKEDY